MTTIKYFTVSFLSFLVVVSLAGCGSGGEAVTSAGTTGVSGSGTTASPLEPPTSGTGGNITPTGVARLSWAAPTNADGTPLSGFTGFKVYYGTSPGRYSSSINVGMMTSYTVSGLSPGTYFFSVTTCDSSGNESGYSNEASKTIP